MKKASANWRKLFVYVQCHCEERSDEAIYYYVNIDCRARLLARNDIFNKQGLISELYYCVILKIIHRN